jgi:undecaprenyl diphosphate synthase
MHIAIIMDGNGRWAAERNLPRHAGHRAGARAVETVVRAAAQRGIGTLTLYAFSCDNWQRPRPEVEALFGLLRRYLLTQTDRCLAESIRLNVIGRRDRLSEALLRQIERSERLTAQCTGLHLRLAIDYSSRQMLIEAGRRLRDIPLEDTSQYLSFLAQAEHSQPAAPEVDLLIRSGGERRLSDFLLWECAYAELWFTDRMWPEFDAADLHTALAEFRGRERRYGGVPEDAGEVAQLSQGGRS